MSQQLLPCLSEERFAALRAQCHLSAEAIESLVAEIHEIEPVSSCSQMPVLPRNAGGESGALQENSFI